MGDVYDRLMRPQGFPEPIRLMSNRHELWAQALCNGHPMAHHAADIRHRSSESPEYIWIANRLQEAAMVYNDEVEHATLLLARTVVGGLLLDEELKLDEVAPWIMEIDG